MSPSVLPQTPAPSSLTTLISTTTDATPLAATTHQVLHNLQHQHLWTSLQIHEMATRFPIPLISGIPPHRVYTHPDEQLYMVERGLREEDVELDRMFVVPTVQGQSWSLEKMAAVFDALPDPAQEEGETESRSYAKAEAEGKASGHDNGAADKATKLAEYYEYRAKARRTGEWGSKRLLLAMIDKGMGGEGTVVYYVVQEGTVKPRQN
ncbi:hypothetical protein BDW71DRAFT_67851 [Aspergillus fruticulosus]